MASPSAGLQQGGVHSRLAQAVLTAYAVPFVALFIQEIWRHPNSGDIAAGTLAMIAPACLHLSAAWVLLRKNTGLAHFDRRFTNWLLSVGLLAGVLGVLVLGIAVAGVVKNGLNETSLIFVVSSPVVVLLVTAQAIMVRRYFGPIAPAAPGNTPGCPRLVAALAWPARRVVSALSPIRSLSIGGLLVLSSLLLTTSVDVGCEHDTYYRGHQILTGQGGWMTGVNATRTAAAIINPVGRVTYAAALICTAIALIVVIRCAAKRKPLHLPSMFTSVVGISAVFTVSDLGMFMYHEQGNTAWFTSALWCCYGVLPLVAYSAFGRSRNPGWRRHWPLVRTCLATLYVPFFAMAWVLAPAVLCFRAPGYLAYFLGVQLLWFGALQTSVAEPVSEMRPSFSSAAARST